VFATPQPAPAEVPPRQGSGVRCRSGSVLLAPESRSVLAPVRLPLRQRHALRYKSGSDAGSRSGLEDGQQIGVARNHTMATRVSAQKLALNERRRLTHLSETTSKDLIIVTTDLFRNDFLINGRKIPLIFRAFIGYLKGGKPPI
jgi:hypothetical protein